MGWCEEIVLLCVFSPRCSSSMASFKCPVGGKSILFHSAQNSFAFMDHIAFGCLQLTDSDATYLLIYEGKVCLQGNFSAFANCSHCYNLELALKLTNHLLQRRLNHRVQRTYCFSESLHNFALYHRTECLQESNLSDQFCHCLHGSCVNSQMHFRS